MTEINNSKTNQTNSKNSFLTRDLKPCFKSLFSSRLFIAIIFALLGSAIAIFAQDYYRQKILTSLNRNFYGPNVFEEMLMAEKRINDILRSHNQYMMNVSNKIQKDQKISKSEVISKQDNENYCYELSFSGFKKEDVNVGIKDNILTFRAENNHENSGKNQKSYSSLNFYYSFLVPDYDHSAEPEIIRNDDKITVKFKKKSEKK